MRIILKYFTFCLLTVLITFCKKDKNPESTSPPINNAPPCNATNLVVDSINYTTGQSKVFKLTVTDYTTTGTNQTSVTAGVYQLTLTVLGDTALTSTTGKRYKIKCNNGWDLLAYSYYSNSDSIWRLITLDASFARFFDVGLKLPLVSNASYSVSLNNNTSNYGVSVPYCYTILFHTFPMYTISNLFSNTTQATEVRLFHFNKAGLLSWSYAASSDFSTFSTTRDWIFEIMN